MPTASTVPTLPEGDSANDARLRTLYHLLTYHRLTFFVYWASFFCPPAMILSFLGLIALLFAPFMIKVLFEQGKKGWLVAFVVMVGVPLGLLLLPTSMPMIRLAMLYLPLGMFYLFCVLLRWAVADWISDSSMTGEEELEAEDREEMNPGPGAF
jgi:uncharacterized membrane protein